MKRFFTGIILLTLLNTFGIDKLIEGDNQRTNTLRQELQDLSDAISDDDSWNRIRILFYANQPVISYFNHGDDSHTRYSQISDPERDIYDEHQIPREDLTKDQYSEALEHVFLIIGQDMASRGYDLDKLSIELRGDRIYTEVPLSDQCRLSWINLNVDVLLEGKKIETGFNTEFNVACIGNDNTNVRIIVEAMSKNDQIWDQNTIKEEKNSPLKVSAIWYTNGEISGVQTETFSDLDNISEVYGEDLENMVETVIGNLQTMDWAENGISQEQIATFESLLDFFSTYTDEPLNEIKELDEIRGNEGV